MTLEAFRVLVHEARERVDRAPVRSSVYEAVLGELRIACFILDHGQSFDEVRHGVNRAVIELALRNVLARRELAGAHDAAQRSLRCLLAVGDERDIEVPPPGTPRILIAPDTTTAIDVGLALVHVRDARELVDLLLGVHGIPAVDVRARLAEKLDGVAGILQRVHDEVA